MSKKIVQLKYPTEYGPFDKETYSKIVLTIQENLGNEYIVIPYPFEMKIISEKDIDTNYIINEENGIDTELCSCEYCMAEMEQNILLDDETGLTIKKTDEGYIVTDCLNQKSAFTRDEMLVISDYILDIEEEDDFEDEEFNCETCPERFNCEDYENEEEYVEVIIKRKDLNKMLFND